MQSVINYIFKQVSANNLEKNEAKVLLSELRDYKKPVSLDIAVIGMACRFPQADSPREFWDNLTGNRNSITPFPEHRKVLPAEYRMEGLYSPAGYLQEIDKFDAAFFRIPPQEARWMTPSHRIMLEVMWSAMEDAGYRGEQVKGSRTGVYIGQDHCLGKDYREYCIDLRQHDPLITTGSYPGLLAGRVSYIFDLKGPSIVVDTACSSGLVAAHLACDALKNGACNQALVGGAFIRATGVNDGGLSLVSGNKLRCFDNRSSGTLWGEGVAALLLKPLDKAVADHDNIHAVIKGSAINNDGGMTSGLTAPNAASQAELLARVWKKLKLNPERISYLESHGTGTRIGDPIEISAITTAFAQFTSKKQFCAIGSVKPNIGHLVSASGLASLIKVVMAFKHGKLPATINFDEPNHMIDFCNSPVYVNDRLRDWPRAEEPRVAGVNAFGFSGTNCHMILMEAEEPQALEGATPVIQTALRKKSPRLYVLSAREEETLCGLVGRYVTFLEENPGVDPAALSYTMAACREHYFCRLAVVADSPAELGMKLAAFTPEAGNRPQTGVFFARHKLVSGKNPGAGTECLTPGDKKRLALELDAVLADSHAGKETGEALFLTLADYYTRGTDIKWEKIYDRDGKLSKLSLPAYFFKPTKYWAQPPAGLKLNPASADEGQIPGADSSHHEGGRRLPVKTVLKGRQPEEGYSEFEQKLASIWAGVLGYSEINVFDSFYDLGGDSINMMKIITEIRSLFKRDPGYKVFIESENIVNLAAVLEEMEPDGEETDYYRLTEDDQEEQEDPTAPFALTDIQFAYLKGRDQQYELGGVVTHVYTEYETSLDIRRLNDALNKLIARHPMLRTVFLQEGRQRYLDRIPEYQITTTDISYLSPEQKEARILEERNRLSHFVYDPCQWPLFLFRALKISHDRHYLFVGFDMLIADGLSLQIICREMMQFYAEPALKLPVLEFDFKKYIKMYEKFKTSPKYLEDKEYWQQRLADFPSPPAIPLKTAPGNIVKPRFKRMKKVLTREKLEAVKRVANTHKVSLSALLCSGYAKVLGFWSNQEKLAINLTVFNRYPFHPQVTSLVGDFTSVMLLGLNLQPGKRFWEQTRDVQQVVLEALEHRHYDGVSVIRDLARAGSSGARANMPFVFTSLLNSMGEEDSPGDWSQLGDMKMALSQTPQVFIDNQVLEMNGELQITWDYVEPLFAEEMITAMFTQYIDLITGCIADKEPSLKLPAADRKLIDTYNNTDTGEISEETLCGLFSAQAAKTPERVAVEFRGEGLTYRELEHRSAQVAAYLHKEKFGHQDFIAVVGSREIATVVHILGILKAGCAYVPLDPDYPRERKEFILEHSQCRLCMEPDFFATKISADEAEFCGDTRPGDTAYAIYTSGSTGEPKGVRITHKAAVNTILDINQKINLTEEDRVLGISSFCFDLSVFDLFGTLSRGATLVMLADQRDTRQLLAAVTEAGITVWNSVPAIMGMLLDSYDIVHPQTADSSLTLPPVAGQQTLYWSSLFFWEKNDETLRVGEHTFPESYAALFPEFYFLTQHGVSAERLCEAFPDIQEGKILKVIEEFREKKILITSLQTPAQVFSSQDRLFDNKYDNTINIDPEEYEKFKNMQLNRSYDTSDSEPVPFSQSVEFPPEIANRRSVRQFREDLPVPLQALGNLLSVFRQTQKEQIVYNYGSAGGLYPIDVYVYIKPRRVEGLAGGVYYYSPAENSLHLISDGAGINQKAYYYTNKTIFQSSAFSLFLIYNAGVSMPKYGSLGYYFATLDAGIMTATVQVWAEKLSLGLCSIGDLDFTSIRKFFKLNGEQVLLHTMEGGLKP